MTTSPLSVLALRGRSARWRSLARLAFTLCLLASAPSRAQQPSNAANQQPSDAEKQTARALVFKGDGAYAEGDFRRALALYWTAYGLVHVPTVGIEVARAEAALGHLRSALRLAQEVVDLPKQPAEPAVIVQARAEAAAWARDLPQRIPSLRLALTPSLSAARIRIDAADVSPTIQERPFLIDPGPHRVHVSALGYRPVDLDIQLAEKERRVLAVTLVPEPTVAAPAAGPAVAAQPGAARAQPAAVEAQSPAKRTAAHLLLGAGAVGVFVGAIEGIVAFVQMPDCPDHRCAREHEDEVEASKRAGNIANVGFAVGGVSGAIGMLLLLDQSDAPKTESAALRVSAGGSGFSLGMSGSF